MRLAIILVESHYKRKGEFHMAELKKGLEGVIAAETKISSIIGSQLTYAG